MPRPAIGAYTNASPALLALRRGAIFFSVVIALAMAAQAMTFAFVHFTSVRYETVSEETAVQQPLTVVGAAPRKPLTSLGDQAPEPPRALGAGDRVLATMSNIASGLGLISLAVVMAQCWMASMIVASTGVVGMQRAIRAATIMTALFAAAVPWTSAIPEAPVWGVFCGYQPLVAASASTQSGARGDLTVITLHGILPLVLLSLLVYAMFNLAVGVSAGIVRHTLDPVVEAEIAAVQQNGAGSLFAGRATGDVSRMMAPVTPIRMAGDNEADRAIADLEKLAGRRRPQDGEPSLRPTGTDPLRRPI
ncbi:MAG: hypothetical protein JSS51_11260 [Planctomycetes bacterium]|nr:hypothetical protein [Planctomycetota bacterium]